MLYLSTDSMDMVNRTATYRAGAGKIWMLSFLGYHFRLAFL